MQQCGGAGVTLRPALCRHLASSEVGARLIGLVLWPLEQTQQLGPKGASTGMDDFRRLRFSKKNLI